MTRAGVQGVLVRESHQLLVVLARDDVLVDRRADDLPAGLRLRVRLAGQRGRGLRLRGVRGHGTVATRRDVRERVSRDVRDLRQARVPAHLRRDPRGAVDTEEIVTAEALWLAARAGVYGCVPLLVAMLFGLDPAWGMLAVPLIGSSPASAGRAAASSSRRCSSRSKFRLRDERRAHAAVPRRGHVLPARPAPGLGAGARATQPALPLRGARAHAVLFGWEPARTRSTRRAAGVRRLMWVLRCPGCAGG
jgi:hypothetical protein